MFKPPSHKVHNVIPSPLGDEWLCPAFNPIREGRYRDSFYDQRSYQLPLKMATPLSFEVIS
ncbi:MAG: hypothetical protein ACQEQO_02415 [Thermodesulfobacteriota bacterium]